MVFQVPFCIFQKKTESLYKIHSHSRSWYVVRYDDKLFQHKQLYNHKIYVSVNCRPKSQAVDSIKQRTKNMYTAICVI